jgi:hypothetical protein
LLRSIAVLIILLSATSIKAQYLHVSGKKIVDKNEEEVILRGMGLGGWMLQEGYMLQTGNFAGPRVNQRKSKIHIAF